MLYLVTKVSDSDLNSYRKNIYVTFIHRNGQIGLSQYNNLIYALILNQDQLQNAVFVNGHQKLILPDIDHDLFMNIYSDDVKLYNNDRHKKKNKHN